MFVVLYLPQNYSVPILNNKRQKSSLIGILIESISIKIIYDKKDSS